MDPDEYRYTRSNILHGGRLIIGSTIESAVQAILDRMGRSAPMSPDLVNDGLQAT